MANGHYPAVANGRELPPQNRHGGKALGERSGDRRDRKNRGGEEKWGEKRCEHISEPF